MSVDVIGRPAVPTALNFKLGLAETKCPALSITLDVMHSEHLQFYSLNYTESKAWLVQQAP